MGGPTAQIALRLFWGNQRKQPSTSTPSSKTDLPTLLRLTCDFYQGEGQLKSDISFVTQSYLKGAIPHYVKCPFLFDTYSDSTHIPPCPQYLPLSPLADLAIVGRLCVTNPRCKCKRFYRSSVAPSTKWGPMWGEQTSTGDSMSLFFELMSWLMLPFFVPRSWEAAASKCFRVFQLSFHRWR